jgi:glucosamine--fructose-6-phosphate aminotransferase (isomerizing)
VVGSSIARITHAGSYTHAGPEIGVASTKAFTAQVTMLTLMALMVGQKKGTITEARFHRLLNELDAIPGKVERVLKTEAQIKYIADIYKDAPTRSTSAVAILPVALGRCVEAEGDQLHPRRGLSLRRR